jgi:AcrR family transcriptional regulator
MCASGNESPPGRRGRGRRPADDVRTEILEAAGRLLLDEGMAKFTVERVASLSGASRMTIHKWWPSKGALAFDGYRASVANVLTFPNTGDVEADLRAQLHAFVRLITETRAGRVLAELIGQSQTDPELQAALIEHYTTPRRNLGVETMKRGQADGQLRRDIDPYVVVDQLWGACYHRLLNPDLPITVGFADALLDNLWRGIAAEKVRKNVPR